MKNNCYLALLFIAILKVASVMYGAADIKGMIKGMGESFGVPPSGYIYSYEIWNDSHLPIYVEQEGIASFMGGFFQSAKGYFGKKKLPSIFDADGAISKGLYHEQDYYFKFFVSDKSSPHEDPIYKQFLTQLPMKKNDPNIYYYHVYTQRNFSKGNFSYKPKVEIIGYQNPSEVNAEKKGTVAISSQLSSLNFFNSTGDNVKVSLTYGTIPYNFTVEKYSHNSLGLPTAQEKTSSEKDSVGTFGNLSSSQVTESQKQEQALPSQVHEVTIQSVAFAGNLKTTTTATAMDSSNQLVNEGALTDKNTANQDDNEKPLFSLRPNTITFSAYNTVSKKYEQFKTLKLPEQGFDGKTYTIEIFQNSDQTLNVGLQGLMPGNYDIAATSRARDLTPCPCSFWYQSLDQMKNVSAADGYIDLPGQLWVVYPGFDNSIQSKVLPGQVVTWNLTRPLLNQGDQFVYFIYVMTTDDKIAKQFVTKVAQQKLGQDVINEYKKVIQTPFVMSSYDQSDLDTSGQVGTDILTLSSDEQVATLMGDLDFSKGIIEDTDLKVIGYILGTDVFSPKGLGFGRFYYTLAPSLASDSNIIALVSNYLDSSKTAALGGDMQIALKKIIKDWSTMYIKNQQTAEQQVEKFLLQYGNSKLVDTTNQQLTTYGKSCLNAIMSGEISLKYPSLKLSTVINHYVYDFGKSAPDNMPQNVIQLTSLSSM